MLKDERRNSKNLKINSHKLSRMVGYFVGSVALFSVSCVVIPKYISYTSGYVYKNMCKKNNRDDDDWGPVIEKKKM